MRLNEAGRRNAGFYPNCESCGGLSRRRLAARHRQAEAMQLVVESRAADAQRLGRLRDVAAMVDQRLLDQLAIDRLTRRAIVSRTARPRGARPAGESCRDPRSATSGCRQTCRCRPARWPGGRSFRVRECCPAICEVAAGQTSGVTFNGSRDRCTCRSRKYRVKRGRSSIRSNSGGIRTGTTFKR